MNSESVHLIATDPPFNKGRDFHATPDSLSSGASFQDRWSWERDVHKEWVEKIKDDFPKVQNVIEGSRSSYGDDMGAFLCFMAVRLVEMKRILREDGSIYLHCDSTASHYLKQLMDSIFGHKNFRNDIVWKRAGGRAKGSQHKPKRFGRDTDSLLFYTKSAKAVFHGAFRIRSPEEIAEKFPYRDEKGAYHTEVPLFCQPSMGERPNLCYEYKGVRNPHPSGWRVSRARLEEMDSRGEIIWREGKRPLRKTYAHSDPGQPYGDLWDDITNLTNEVEKVGYPTQKPLDLYERIIEASSNEGDIVLDPFAGCATTCIAAEKLNRQWVGIDIWNKVQNVVLDRLEKEGLKAPKHSRRKTALKQGFLFADDLYFTSELPERTDYGEEAVPFLMTKKRIDEPKDEHLSDASKRKYLLEQYGSKCQGCDREFDDDRYLEMDHNTPLSDGGWNHIKNRILLCGPCNKLKSNKYTLSGLRAENKKLGHMAK